MVQPGWLSGLVFQQGDLMPSAFLQIDRISFIYAATVKRAHSNTCTRQWAVRHMRGHSRLVLCRCDYLETLLCTNGCCGQLPSTNVQSQHIDVGNQQTP